MEQQDQDYVEKRFSPRISASGKLSCKAYRMSDGYGPAVFNHISMFADLVDISMDGMKIKSSVAIENRFLMEYRSTYQISRVALVRWVKKIGDEYYAGLLCI